MKPAQFLNGNNLRKLNKQYAEFLSKDDRWNSKRRTAAVRIKRFEQVDVLSPERNGVSSVVQVVDQLIEVNNLFWTTGERFSSSLYVNAVASTTHGFGAKEQVLMVYKDSRNRKTSTELYRTWERKDFNECARRLVYSLDFSKVRENMRSVKWEVRNRYEKYVQRELIDLLYSEMRELERGVISERLASSFSRFGITLLQSMAFTDKFGTHGIEGVKTSGLNVKFAINNVSTYCALPSTLEIQFRKSEVPTLSLAKLKIETSGYYSHSERLKIRPEHKMHAMKLMREFKSLNKTKGA
jgi:hypothetical protein